MPADLPGWLREEAQKLRERGGPPRGGEAVAIIAEHYARVAEEMLAAEVARVRADVAEEIARAIEGIRAGWMDQHKPEEIPGVSEALHDAAAMARVVGEYPVAAAESVVGAPTPAARHPEDDCHRCGRSLAIPWAAPSPLWNAVMRGGSINGEELFDGIVCPTCFAQLAQDRGIAEVWHFDAARVLVPLETVTPSGRVWDERAWLWREPVGAPTSISAPSDVAAPRDALTDQDFTDLRADVAGVRAADPESDVAIAEQMLPAGVEVLPDYDPPTAHTVCGAIANLVRGTQPGSQAETVARVAYRAALDASGWRALPEDEGTRDA